MRNDSIDSKVNSQIPLVRPVNESGIIVAEIYMLSGYLQRKLNAHFDLQAGPLSCRRLEATNCGEFATDNFFIQAVIYSFQETPQVF